MLTIYSDDHHLHHGRCELMDGQLMPCFEMPSRADHVLQRTPDLAGDQMQSFVRGLIALEGRMISLIDLNLVLEQAQAQAEAA